MRFLSLLLLLSSWAHAEAWRVAGDEQFPPYSYLDSAQQSSGLDVELVQTILKTGNISHNLRLYPWERVKQMLARGDVEMAFQFAGTPERFAQYRLVGPIRQGTTVIITRTELPLRQWRNFADLKPYVIGQVRGYSYEPEFDRAELTRDLSAQNPAQLLAMLLAGRVDVIVGDKTQLLFLARQINAINRLRVLDKPLIVMPRYVAFNKMDEARASEFAQAFGSAQKAGVLDAILRRWGG